ncbi:unnamed protein product [Durusdinium trenchii]|uniref:AB hydrolase-1 domain-containing protein n=1 Tax=Durusdinium trenchii TaxID=1381693 RepID=A0ABP0NWL4_9DINO
MILSPGVWFGHGAAIRTAQPAQPVAPLRCGSTLPTRCPWPLLWSFGVGGVLGSRRNQERCRLCRRSLPAGKEVEVDFKGHRVRCVTCAGSVSKPDIVLVHGFGGSIEYWRRLIPALSAEGYTVHAFDLLGLGLSEKPSTEYSIELWAEQVTDFVSKLEKDVVLVGNSFGSLISLVSATQRRPKGIVMLNCAVGMNNKNMVKSPKMNDLQRLVATLILGLVDLIFRSPILDMAFESFATKEQVAAVLKNLYPTNPSAVDDELAEGFVRPAGTPGALEVLRQIYTGDPGPTPMELFAKGFPSDLPLKVIWGDQDNLTPIKGPQMGSGQCFGNCILSMLIALQLAERAGIDKHNITINCKPPPFEQYHPRCLLCTRSRLFL